MEEFLFVKLVYYDYLYSTIKTTSQTKNRTYGNKNKFQSEGNEVCTPVIKSYRKELEILYAQGMGALQAG